MTVKNTFIDVTSDEEGDEKIAFNKIKSEPAAGLDLVLHARRRGPRCIQLLCRPRVRCPDAPFEHSPRRRSTRAINLT